MKRGRDNPPTPILSEADFVNITTQEVRSDQSLRLLRAHDQALRERVAVLTEERTELWSCPECAFTFDAMHTDADGGYSCPACAESKLSARVAVLEAGLRRYGRHTPVCASDWVNPLTPPDDPKCDCGLSDVMEQR